MKLLFLTTRLPYPPCGGERVRPYYFLKYLPRDWNITLLSFVEHDSESNVLSEYRQDNVRIRTVRLSRFESYSKSALSLFGKDPLQVAYYSSGRMARLVQEELRSGSYDCAFAHLLRMGHYLKKFASVPKILDLSDALTLRYALSSPLQPPVHKFIEGLESRRLGRYEPWIARQFDRALVASRIDKRYLEERLGVKELEVVENGVDLPDLEERPVRMNSKKIVFFGNMRTFHNADAARYFYTTIFPVVRRSVPDVQFYIVGASIPGFLKAFGRDTSVHIVSDVDSIRPHVEDACVSVAPMRVAVGIQNKILQSMAYRVAVVTTGIGLGGIRARSGEQLLVADEPADFAAGVIRCLQDQPYRMSLVEAAYRLVRDEYAWPTITRGIEKLIESVLLKKHV